MVSFPDVVQRNKDYTLASWTAQSGWNPITMERAEGVYFWDHNDKRYIDWSSQLMNVNVGHGHPHVIKAIQEQAAKVTYAYPGIATEPRGRLGEMLQEVTPPGLTKTFFTNAGADAIENAMKLARLYTGKQKVLTRYRSYHGATFGAMTAGGDPRRLGNEPGVPWIVRLPDPYAYRSPVYRGLTEQDGDLAVADMIEEIVQMEGPGSCAAIMWEGYNGSSGIIQPGPAFFWRLREVCDRYGLVLIVDEVMSGFGRTGEWFGIDHYPDVKVDIMALAKGLTSGYVPLGAAVVSEEIAAHFDDHVVATGLTYSAHALGCAAAIANIEVYRDEGLIDNSREMGKKLRQGLLDLAEQHPCVGDVRGTGLHQVLEIVKNRETREPMSAWNHPLTEAMATVAGSLRADGMNTFVRWNWIFNCPPLILNDAQLQEGLAIIDNALNKIDSYYEG